MAPAPVEAEPDRGSGARRRGLADCARDRAAAPVTADAAPVAAGSVATVEPNEVNELDLAAAAPTPAPAELSWIKYLLATLGAALAAASTVRFLFV